MLRSPFGALDGAPVEPRQQAMALLLVQVIRQGLRQQEPSLNTLFAFLFFSLICIAANKR